MTSEVRQSATLAVAVTPTEVWTTPVASVRSPDGTELATPTATQDSTSTTVVSATNAYTFVAASVSGMVAGKQYLVTHDGVDAVATVARLDGTTVYLVDALPWTPEASDTIKGLEITLTVPAAATADRAANYWVEVTDDAVDGREERAVFHVVRRPFLPPISAADIRSIVMRQWPHETISEAEYQDLADDVHEEIRDELLSTGEYAHMYLDPAPFRQVAKIIARRMLATQRGLFAVGAEPEEYLARLERERSRVLGRVITSITPRDADDDGAVDDDDLGVMSGEYER